jgi:hypothetical protein
LEQDELQYFKDCFPRVVPDSSKDAVYLLVLFLPESNSRKYSKHVLRVYHNEYKALNDEGIGGLVDEIYDSMFKSDWAYTTQQTIDTAFSYEYRFYTEDDEGGEVEKAILYLERLKFEDPCYKPEESAEEETEKVLAIS